MKLVRSSSHVSKVPSLSSSNHVFASQVRDRGNIIRRTASFSSISVFKHIANSEEMRECVYEEQFGSKPSNWFPLTRSMGEAAAGSGCSSAGSISSSCGMYSGYIDSGTKSSGRGDCGSSGPGM
ncbi:hypothetical protein Tco_0241593 [Tanacetum coccineum]